MTGRAAVVRQTQLTFKPECESLIAVPALRIRLQVEEGVIAARTREDAERVALSYALHVEGHDTVGRRFRYLASRSLLSGSCRCRVGSPPALIRGASPAEQGCSRNKNRGGPAGCSGASAFVNVPLRVYVREWDQRDGRSHPEIIAHYPCARRGRAVHAASPACRWAGLRVRMTRGLTLVSGLNSEKARRLDRNISDRRARVGINSNEIVSMIPGAVH
jgi:hypothetical protein